MDNFIQKCYLNVMKIHLQDSDERRHFFIKKLEAVDTRIFTLYTGTFSASFDKNVAPHKHNFLEIMFIDKGEGIIEINEHQYHAKDGDIVVYFPSMLHREYSTKKNNKLHATFFAVKYNSSLQEMFTKFHKPYVFASNKDKDLFKMSMDYLIEESQNEDVPYVDKIVNCISKTIILKILQISIEQEAIIESNEFIYGMQKYLDEHYKEEIDFDEYYKTLPFSKYYISRLFKTCTGTTPKNYVISKRMQEARKLLNDTNMQIQEIASEVGYKDIYYFTKSFKKEVGASPTKYRQAKQ